MVTIIYAPADEKAEVKALSRDDEESREQKSYGGCGGEGGCGGDGGTGGKGGLNGDGLTYAENGTDGKTGPSGERGEDGKDTEMVIRRMDD